MHVKAKVHSRLPHARTGQKDLWALLHRGLRPFPVQISAGRVDAQITTPRTVWVHMRHDIQYGLIQHHAGHRIRRVDQAPEETFHPPGSLALSRMLPPDGPAHSFTVARFADCQQIKIGAVNRLSQHRMTNPR